ncbi:ATP-binding protein [Ancylobacter sp. SL191]|uniref:ATP-binding protein n=1 Tax=Ancylobacter sp. SL191 TaxID=2995166 RepID=UPI00226EAE5D|nr:ATP-binding protein [Ancylobacter sp. SL191]WAC26056.1 ATP-binding protein [Ancylobacter sp. SL191]
MIIREIDLSLPNQLSQMEGLVAALDFFIETCAVPAKPAYRLHLAVDEFVNNAVDYGYKDGRAGEIGVHLRHLGGALELTLSDDGDAFDPFNAPPPDLTGTLDERRIGGLGVHLVRTLADSFAYKRENGRNVVTLRLSLAGEAAQAREA